MDDRGEMSAGRLILFTASIMAAMYGLSAVLVAITHLEGQSGTSGHQAMEESATALDVASIYGARNGTSAGVWDLHVNVLLPDGASAIDITRLVVEFHAAGGTAERYVHAPDALADAAAPSTTFNATWTRGAGGSSFVMSPSDRVTLHFNLVAAELPTRTAASVTLLPEVGRTTTESYATPGTYGTDAVVLLR